jgi:hypothetical protein
MDVPEIDPDDPGNRFNRMRGAVNCAPTATIVIPANVPGDMDLIETSWRLARSASISWDIV